jgi:RNA polymerase sigma factor (sigma-70 family)
MEELYKVVPQKDYKLIKGLAYQLWVKSFSFITMDDLLQEGLVAYLKGKEKYDFSKNNYFMGFVYKRVKGAMLDYIASMSLNKSKTVRNIEVDESKHLLVTAPENVENYHYNNDAEDELIEDIERANLYDSFMVSIEALNKLEQNILFSYFIEGKSLVEIGKHFKVDRTKIKILIVNCVSFIRRRLKLPNIDSGVDFVGIGRTRI